MKQALILTAVLCAGCYEDALPLAIVIDAGAGPALCGEPAPWPEAEPCFDRRWSPARTAATTADPYPADPIVLPAGTTLPSPVDVRCFDDGECGVPFFAPTVQEPPGISLVTTAEGKDGCRAGCEAPVGLVEWAWLPAPALRELGFFPYAPAMAASCRVLPRPAPVCPEDPALAYHRAVTRALAAADYQDLGDGRTFLAFGPDQPWTGVEQLRIGRAFAAACEAVNGWSYDRDRDGAGDGCDNCVEVANRRQANRDGDGLGDVCDPCPDRFVRHDDQDADRDGVPDCDDLCPGRSDDQRDTDGDGIGDACDVCPRVPDPAQRKSDGDIFGDACDVCPDVADDQRDRDDDGVGDVCDNCPDDDNPDQSDADELTPWAADYPGGDACDPPGRPMVIDTAPLPLAVQAQAAEAVAGYVITQGGEEWSWARIVAEAAESFDAPAPGEPVVMAARAPLAEDDVVGLAPYDPLVPDRERDQDAVRLGFRIGRHFEDVMKRERCIDIVDPETGFLLQEAQREVRYFRPTRNMDDPLEVLAAPNGRARYRRADCFYEALGGRMPDGRLAPRSLPTRIEEYKASRSRAPRFSRSYRRRIREQAEDLKWLAAVRLREEFFPDREWRDLWARLHEPDFWPWGKPPLGIYRCVPGFNPRGDCAAALREAFGGLLMPMAAARTDGAGTAFQWVVDSGLSTIPPEFMEGCRTPPREWHRLGPGGWTQVWRHCDWGPWRRNGDWRRFQLADIAPVADGMYVDADWYNPDTRRLNQGLIQSFGQDSAALAAVAFWPWGVAIGRALMHNELEPQAPGGRIGWPVRQMEQGWWLLVQLDDLVLMQGIPEFDLDGDEAYDLAIE